MGSETKMTGSVDFAAAKVVGWYGFARCQAQPHDLSTETHHRLVFSQSFKTVGTYRAAPGRHPIGFAALVPDKSIMLDIGSPHCGCDMADCPDSLLRFF